MSLFPETRVPKKTVNCVASTQFNGFADPSRRRRRRRSSLIITRTTGMEVLEVGGIAECPKCVSLRREIETCNAVWCLISRGEASLSLRSDSTSTCLEAGEC